MYCAFALSYCLISSLFRHNLTRKPYNKEAQGLGSTRARSPKVLEPRFRVQGLRCRVWGLGPAPESSEAEKLGAECPREKQVI